MESIKRRAWDEIITPEDAAVYQRAGLGHVGGLGKQPGILIIDVQYRTVGLEPAPIEVAQEKYYRTACGDYGWNAVKEIAKLLQAARLRRVPIFYPYVAPKEQFDAGRLGAKVTGILEIDRKGYEFVAECAPEPGDILIPKKHPSAFFGTPLASYLIDRRIDTLLVCGCTTSGCVRAAVTDAFAYNWRVAVIEECVYDRGQVSHAVNLFDMQSKYADVISLAEAIRYLEDVDGQ